MKTTIRLAVVAVAVAALSVPGSAAGAAADEGSNARPSAIGWAPCVEDVTAECGTVRVPIDWSRPHGPTVDLALARRRATDPRTRIGMLLLNPGGPGGSGVNYALFGPSSPGRGGDNLQRRFDIVGFDPRGIARSHPVVCSEDLLRRQPPHLLTSQGDFDRMVAYNRRLGADCRRHTGPLFDHIDSLSTARDIDAIRAALGEDTLTLFAISYGTLMAQHYAELFPHRVRALVLDSIIDHSLGTASFLGTGAASVQDSFAEFVNGCSRDVRCALHGRDIRALWSSLLARTAHGDLRDPTDPTVVLTSFELTGNTFGSLYDADWFGLAHYLAAVDAQTPFAAAADPISAETESALATNPFQAVFCQDWNLPLHDYAEFATRLRAQNRIAPDMRFSPFAVDATVGCLGWPATVTNPQHRLRVSNTPKLLILNARHDPVTGYAWAVHAARQLGRHARLVTYDGWGHGVYAPYGRPPRSDCVIATVEAYLMAGTLPGTGARCDAVQPEPTPLIAAARAYYEGRRSESSQQGRQHRRPSADLPALPPLRGVSAILCKSCFY